MNENKNSFQIQPFIYLMLITLFTCLVLNTTSGTLRCGRYVITLLIAAVLLFLLRKSLKVTDASVIIGMGVLLRWLYILYTETWERQHDVVAFGAGEGHAAYIEYFLTHKSLPDFDPRSIWGFFQPPLHHIISAIWMKISYVCGCSDVQSQENVQGLTFFYMSAVLILTYFICRELNLSKWAERIALCIVAFHPVYIILSGSINNDALSLLFSVLALYLVILWYKKPSFITIILLALSIGLSMLAKLSGYMIAPAVAALFILRLADDWKDKKLLIKDFLQYAVFLVICAPIGLFWTIRNMIKFNMPINYIPGVGGQFEGGLFTRLFDFTISSPFPAMLENGDTYYEHNIFLSMMKTSLFGEYNYSANNPKIFGPVCLVLFVAAIVLAVLAFLATVLLLFSKKSSLKLEHKLLFGILYLTVMGSYLGFALSYSNFSAQDFRYAAIVIIVEAIMLGIFTEDFVKSKIMKNIIKGATACFCICSFITYVCLGLFTGK